MSQSRPNIILIMCDQMRWDAAGFTGSSVVQTPHLGQITEMVCHTGPYDWCLSGGDGAASTQ